MAALPGVMYLLVTPFVGASIDNDSWEGNWALAGVQSPKHTVNFLLPSANYTVDSLQPQATHSGVSSDLSR